MAEGTLILHAGGKLVTLQDLLQCKTPPPEGRWHPVSHVRVVETVKETLHGAGYVVKSEQLALARNDARFFGVLNLETPLAQGVGLSVGVRNSVDKSYPRLIVMPGWSEISCCCHPIVLRNAP